MAIRKVIFNVSKNGTVPLDYQWGGVQNEDNATEINFILDEDYIGLINEGGGNIAYRIDFNSAFAGYQPSENLLMEENAVKRTIPKNITRYGGEFTSNLVITRLFENGTAEEILSVPVTLFFTALSRQDETVISNLSAFEENILKKVDETNMYSSQAKETLNTIEQKLASGEFKGEKGEKGDKGETYILTQADINEITKNVLKNFTDVSGVGK